MSRLFKESSDGEIGSAKADDRLHSSNNAVSWVKIREAIVI